MRDLRQLCALFVRSADASYNFMHFIEGRALPPQVEPKEGCFLPFPLRNGPMEVRVASCLVHDTIHLHGGTRRPSVLLCVSSKIGWVSATEFFFGILAVVRIPVPQIRASYSFPFPISFLKLHQSGQPNIRVEVSHFVATKSCNIDTSRVLILPLRHTHSRFRRPSFRCFFAL